LQIVMQRSIIMNIIPDIEDIYVIVHLYQRYG